MRFGFWSALSAALTLSATQVGIANPALSVKNTVVGQFLTVSNRASVAQQDLLQQTFQVHFPISVITVGDAMNYLLRTTGYHMVHDGHYCPWAEQMMRSPLPMAQRNLGPMTIEEGLQTLAGSDFQMIEDQVNRLIAFRVKPSLEDLYYPAVSVPHFSR